MPTMTRKTHERAVVAVNWRGHYASGVAYDANDMSHQDGYIGISLEEDNYDAIVPYNIGDPQYGTLGAPWDVTPPQTTDVVQSGVRYTFTKGGFIRSVYVHVPEVLPDTRYTLVALDITNPDNPVSTTISEMALTANDYTLVAYVNKFILPGADFIIYISAQTSVTSTSITGGWTSESGSDTAAPDPEGWNTDLGQAFLRIDKTDLDGDDRTTELMGILAGGEIHIYETTDANKSVTFAVDTNATDNGSYIGYDVTLIKLGVSGAPRKNRTTTIEADTPVYQPTKYSKSTGWWLNQPSFAVAGGYLRIGGVEPVGFDPNDAFGVDLEFQEATKSAKWDIIPVGENPGSASVPGQDIGPVVKVGGFNGEFTVGQGSKKKTIVVQHGQIKEIL